MNLQLSFLGVYLPITLYRKDCLHQSTTCNALPAIISMILCYHALGQCGPGGDRARAILKHTIIKPKSLIKTTTSVTILLNQYYEVLCASLSQEIHLQVLLKLEGPDTYDHLNDTHQQM